MRKKLFTLLLAFAASIGTMFAESGTCGDNLTWDLTDGVLTISGTGPMTSYYATSAPWSPYSISIKSITICNGVTSIGYNAFIGCKNVKIVIIPNSVNEIGPGAFNGCMGLTSIEIPNSVTIILDYAFSGCNGLTSLTIPNSVTSIGSHAFYNVPNVVYNGIATGSPWGARSVNGFVDGYLIYDDALKTTLLACSSAAEGEIIIPNSVTSIGEYAFFGCSSLTYVTLSNSITSIGIKAFEGCSGLEAPVLNMHIFARMPTSYSGNYIIPEGIELILDNAFAGCSNLTSITIPNSVTSIGSGAFKDCTSLPVIENVRYADTYLVGVKKKLSTYTIKEGTKWIGSNAFEDCIKLTSITIPNTVVSIENSAFYKCEKLTSVTIPDNVISIKGHAFGFCSQLTSIIIGNSVTSIGDWAFYPCGSLTDIYLKPTTPPAKYSDTFSYISPNAIFYIPFGTISKYKSAWGNKNFQEPNIQYSTNTLSTSASIMFDVERTEIQSCGIEGGEQQPGNVLEYIGLEPNSEYNDIPIVLTANTGETETVNVSFTTTALTLTTKPSKPVSATTAILLAETNMSDAETSCGFEYKRNDAPADMDGTKVYCPVASGQMAGRLKGLKDDVYYKYRAFYQSAAGNMFYGDWQYIFTGDVAVEFDPILYTYGATVVRENEATISGYALAGSEDFTEQGFEYWAESRTNSGANAPHRVPAALNEHFFVQASGIALRATLTNLDAGTVYKYRVYGKVGDQYYYGAEQSFATQGEYEGDDSEAIEEISSDQVPSTKAQKILRNGQIFILRGDKTYTLQGMKVK